MARGFAAAAAVVALIAIAAGLTGHGDIGLWCIPFFVILGAISSASNQNAKKLAKSDGAPIDVAKKAGMSALGVFLALVLIAALVIAYLFYILSHLGRG